MIRKALACSAALLLAAGLGHAQLETVLENFDTDTVTSNPNWTDQDVSSGEFLTYNATDSQSGSGGSITFNDSGFSYFAQRVYPGQITSDGAYQVRFWYKNGPDSTPGVDSSGLFEDVNLQINGGANIFPTNFIGLDPSETLAWTEITTPATNLTTGDLTLRWVSNSSGATITMQVDTITLIELPALPISFTVDPLDTALIDDVETITVVPVGGSGIYTQADFDVDGDSVIDFTDNTPGDGFTFDLDTTALADGPVSIEITVTDDATDSGTATVTYTVDNAEGRDVLFVDGFETAFSGGLPVGWNRVDWDSAGAAGGPFGTIAQNTAIPFEGASALEIDYATNPNPNRYTLASDDIPGGIRNAYRIQGAVRGPGGFTRLGFATSDDSGATWTVNIGQLFNPGSTDTAWVTGLGPIVDPAAEPATTNIRIVTHKFSDGTALWDDIEVTASEAALDVQEWDLY